MRLFLHGKSSRSVTLQKIRQYQEQLQQRLQSDDENDSFSSLVSTSTDGAALLSGFDLNDEEICDSLCNLFEPTSSWSEIKLQNCHGNGLGKVLAAVLRTASVGRLMLLNTSHEQSRMLSCSAAQALGDGLGARTCNIESLLFKGLRFAEASMAKIARGLRQNTQLQELSFKGAFTNVEMDRGHSSLDIGAATVLAKGLKCNTSLEILEFDETNLSDMEISCLLSAMQGNRNLTALSLRGNACGGNTLESLGFVLSQGQDEGSCSITKLDLSAQRSEIQDEDDGVEEGRDWLDWSPLFLALQTDPLLAKLNLSENHLDRNDMSDLASALCASTNLRELDLSNCCISDHGLSAFAEFLPDFEGLVRLRINGEQQQFGKKGVKRLIRNLAYNVYLERLELPVGLDKSRTMQLYLNLNRAGRRFLMRDEDDDAVSVPKCLWPKLLLRAGRIARREAISNDKKDDVSADVIYHLVRGGLLISV